MHEFPSMTLSFVVQIGHYGASVDCLVMNMSTCPSEDWLMILGIVTSLVNPGS